MKFYRYYNHRYSSGVFCQEFILDKETPKGYWIVQPYDLIQSYGAERKWVSKTGKKRYAYPTKLEAMISFKARKKKQIKLLESQLEATSIALTQIENLLSKES